MDDQFQLLFDKMKIEMQKQTIELTNNILDKMDEKLKPIQEENQRLNLKVKKLEKKVEVLERDRKRNNIIVHGLAEKEQSTLDLMMCLKNHISDDLGINIESYEINNIYRIGKKIRTRNLGLC